jgi:hypothetical protein
MLSCMDPRLKAEDDALGTRGPTMTGEVFRHSRAWARESTSAMPGIAVVDQERMDPRLKAEDDDQ